VTSKLEQIHKEAGQDHGSNGHSDKTANDHRGEHLAHQELMFFRRLSHRLTGRFRNDGIKREAIERGQTIAETQREGELHNFGSNPSENSHPEDANHNQTNHRQNNGGQHFRRAILKSFEDEHCQGEHQNVKGIATVQNIGFQKA